ncbi:MAG: hypothetical protein B7Z14_04945, partial [Bosea sp. 32-68-6]
HARARRAAGGITIDWIRRSRIDADSWDLAEVPLGEEVERYDVAVRLGGVVLRRQTTDRAAWFYPNAEELADFGAAQAEIEIVIAQISAAVGRGQEYLGRLPIR